VAEGLGGASRLKENVPSIGTFFTPLPLKDAFLELDAQCHISARIHVPPSFNDVRHVLNRAQVMAIASRLRLITFDGDQTLYEDQRNLENPDSDMVNMLVALLEHGVYVAVVTAAGYPNQPERYEARLTGLLRRFEQDRAPEELTSRFFVLGGECNYLIRCTAEYRLAQVPEQQFQTPEILSWPAESITQLIQVAKRSLTYSIKTMCLEADVITKERSCGMVPRAGHSFSREQLDEVCIGARVALKRENVELPFCAFNGGSDVWVDVGNKLIGVKVLRGYLRCSGDETIHYGDQFLSTGNDLSTRTACTTVWIGNPAETEDSLRGLLACLAEHKDAQHAKSTSAPATPAKE